MKRCEGCVFFEILDKNSRDVSDIYDVGNKTHGLCRRAVQLQDVEGDLPSMVTCDASRYFSRLYVARAHCCKEWKGK